MTDTPLWASLSSIPPATTSAVLNPSRAFRATLGKPSDRRAAVKIVSEKADSIISNLFFVESDLRFHAVLSAHQHRIGEVPHAEM